jgi:hypothetical protein
MSGVDVETVSQCPHALQHAETRRGVASACQSHTHGHRSIPKTAGIGANTRQERSRMPRFRPYSAINRTVSPGILDGEQMSRTIWFTAL